GAVLLEPGCCCGLDTLAEWEEILLERPGEWRAIWVGHDYGRLEVRLEAPGQGLPFRSYAVPSRAAAMEYHRRVSLEAASQMIRWAWGELEALARHLLPLLPTALSGERRRLVASVLAGLPRPA